jgi:hypothetical protein
MLDSASRVGIFWTYNMKVRYVYLLATILLGGIVIALITLRSCRRNNSTETIIPLSVSLAKCQHDKNESIIINVVLTNNLHRQVTIRRLSFGLVEYRGEEGFYIEDDQTRCKCRGYYNSGIGFICGIAESRLQPMDTVRETITIPAEANLAPGSYEIPYELRIPFYGNEKPFSLASGETITVYLDPRDRPVLDEWRDRFRDFINGDGWFTMRGKLEFVVE